MGLTAACKLEENKRRQIREEQILIPCVRTRTRITILTVYYYTTTIYLLITAFQQKRNNKIAHKEKYFRTTVLGKAVLVYSPKNISGVLFSSLIGKYTYLVFFLLNLLSSPYEAHTFYAYIRVHT